MKWLIGNGIEYFSGFNVDGTIRVDPKHKANRFAWEDIVNNIMPILSDDWLVCITE